MFNCYIENVMFRFMIINANAMFMFMESAIVCYALMVRIVGMLLNALDTVCNCIVLVDILCAEIFFSVVGIGLT